MLVGSLAVRVYTVGITVGRKTIAPSRNLCDPDFFCSRLAIEHRCHCSFGCREPMWSRCLCSRLAIRHRCYSSVCLQGISVTQNFCSRFCEQASIRSPAEDHLYSFFFPTGGHMTQRSFWAGSKVELNQCGPCFSVCVTKTPSTSARLFSHTARRNVPLLLQRFSEKSQVQRARTPSPTPKDLSPKDL